MDYLTIKKLLSSTSQKSGPLVILRRIEDEPRRSVKEKELGIRNDKSVRKIPNPEKTPSLVNLIHTSDMAESSCAMCGMPTISGNLSEDVLEFDLLLSYFHFECEELCQISLYCKDCLSVLTRLRVLDATLRKLRDEVEAVVGTVKAAFRMRKKQDTENPPSPKKRHVTNEEKSPSRIEVEPIKSSPGDICSETEDSFDLASFDFGEIDEKPIIVKDELDISSFQEDDSIAFSQKGESEDDRMDDGTSYENIAGSEIVVSKKRFTCSECTKSYAYDHGLKRHMRIHKKQNLIIVNDELDISGSQENDSDAFLSKGESEEDLVDDGTSNEDTADSEIAVSKKRFPCPECGKNYAYDRSLKRHMRIHQRENLKQSINTVENNDEGDKDEFANASCLKENDFSCSVCIASFKTDVEFKEHASSCQKAATEEDNIYKCGHCQQEFARLAKLKSHEAVAHPVESTENEDKVQTELEHGNSPARKASDSKLEDSDEGSDTDSRRRPTSEHTIKRIRRRALEWEIKCVDCGNNYRKWEELKNHFLEEHLDTLIDGEDPFVYKCPKCPLFGMKHDTISQHVKEKHKDACAQCFLMSRGNENFVINLTSSTDSVASARREVPLMQSQVQAQESLLQFQNQPQQGQFAVPQLNQPQQGQIAVPQLNQPQQGQFAVPQLNQFQFPVPFQNQQQHGQYPVPQLNQSQFSVPFQNQPQQGQFAVLQQNQLQQGSQHLTWNGYPYQQVQTYQYINGQFVPVAPSQPFNAPNGSVPSFPAIPPAHGVLAPRTADVEISAAKTVNCTDCSETFISYRLMWYHRRTRHQKMSFECANCGATLVTKQAMKYHCARACKGKKP